MKRVFIPSFLGPLVGLGLVACTPQPQVTQVPEGATLMASGDRPDGAREGACYGKDVTPAVIETITESKQVTPAVFAPDGATIITPPQYETVTKQVIAAGGEVYYFEVPCPDAMTPEFIASVQRALAARGGYNGSISGVMDGATRSAIRAFQLPGFNSEILTLETARKLGLVSFAPAPIYERES